jgi:hypothetical protein
LIQSSSWTSAAQIQGVVWRRPVVASSRYKR